MKLYELFKQHDIRLFCTHESLPETQEGVATKFTYTILAAAAEFELAKIRENTCAAKAYAKKHDLYIGSKPVFGYKLVAKGKVERDPVTDKIVIQVFDRFIRGETLRSIGRWMTDALPRGGFINRFV